MKQRALFMAGLLGAALVFGSVFLGCDAAGGTGTGTGGSGTGTGGTEDTGGDGTGTGGISLADLAGHIAGLPANTAANPHTVRLARTNITTGGVMGGINRAVRDRYVILDLSDCSATGNKITGTWEVDPGSNDMNVIKDNQYIVGVILPSSLTSIGSGAFASCTSLTSVTIPGSVTSIGNMAFNGCTGLTSVTIGNSVTSIGSSAFSGCTGLTSVTIGNSVTSIGSSAFSGCTGLTSIDIPGSVTSIGGSAFLVCTGLTSVTFGEGSSISQADFSSNNFPGDLRAKYLAQGGGPGRYTRDPANYNNPWTKQS
jgi:hypothetical protein